MAEAPSTADRQGYIELSPSEKIDEGDIHAESLPEDAYGAAMFSLIYDARELLSGSDHDAKPFWLNMYRLAFVMGILMVNYLFQLLMLVWIYEYIVQPSVHNVQHVYDRFHGEFFSLEGKFMQEVWDGKDSQDDQIYKDNLCHMVFSKFTFLSLVLMLWVMQMVIEFRNNVQLTASIYTIHSCPNDRPELMIATTGGGFAGTEADDDMLYVQGLTPLVRWSVVVLILLPKIFIGIILTLLGLVWLSATESFSELILNSLALEFVIKIDDSLFTALLPEHYRDDMTRVTLLVPRAKVPAEEAAVHDWKFWRTSTAYLVFIPTSVYLFLEFGQCLPVIGVMPFWKNDIAQACEPYLQSQAARICPNGFGAEQCFDFGGWKP